MSRGRAAMARKPFSNAWDQSEDFDVTPWTDDDTMSGGSIWSGPGIAPTAAPAAPNDPTSVEADGNVPGTGGNPPTTFADIPTLATYLISGYWAFSNYDGTQPRSWAYKSGHIVTVNM